MRIKLVKFYNKFILNDKIENKLIFDKIYQEKKLEIKTIRTKL